MVVWLHGRMERDGDKEDGGTGAGEAEGKEMEKETWRRETIQPQLSSSQTNGKHSSSPSNQ